MVIKVELFYSPICPHCPEAKRILLEVLEEVDQEFHVEEVNVFSPEGLERAKKYEIISVPAIIIENKHKIIGVPRKESLLRKITHEITVSQKEEKS